MLPATGGEMCADVKIVVVSDTHLPRFVRRLDAALRLVASERPDAILHCGDMTTLAALEPFEWIAPLDAVAGNNDGDDIVQRYGRRKIVDVGGLRIGMIHGDGAHGTTLGRARAAFEGETLDAIVFGHSHVPHVERRGSTWILNPGSPTDKRLQAQYSFAVLETSDAGPPSAPRIVLF